MEKVYDGKCKYLTADVLPKVDYSLCGFSPVHGDKIAVFDVYLDESGTHDNQRLVVGGYVSQVERWVSFSQEWKRVLVEYSLSYFHMKEFRNPKSRAYKHLAARDKENLLNSLVDVICQNVLFGAVFFIRPYLYEQMTTPAFRSRYGSCYSHAVQGCLGLVIAFLRKMETRDERLGIFVEEGHRNAQEVVEVIRQIKKETDPMELLDDMDGDVYVDPLSVDPTPYSEEDDPLLQRGLKIGAYGLGSKKDMLPLQAADVLAYCVHDASRLEAHPTKSVMSKLVSGAPHYGWIEDKRRILQFVEDAEKDKRIRAGQDHRKYILKRQLQQSGFVVENRVRGLTIRGSTSRMASFALIHGIKPVEDK